MKICGNKIELIDSLINTVNASNTKMIMMVNQ